MRMLPMLLVRRIARLSHTFKAPRVFDGPFTKWLTFSYEYPPLQAVRRCT